MAALHWGCISCNGAAYGLIPPRTAFSFVHDPETSLSSSAPCRVAPWSGTR